MFIFLYYSASQPKETPPAKRKPSPNATSSAASKRRGVGKGRSAQNEKVDLFLKTMNEGQKERHKAMEDMMRNVGGEDQDQHDFWMMLSRRIRSFSPRGIRRMEGAAWQLYLQVQDEEEAAAAYNAPGAALHTQNTTSASYNTYQPHAIHHPTPLYAPQYISQTHSANRTPTPQHQHSYNTPQSIDTLTPPPPPPPPPPQRQHTAPAQTGSDNNADRAGAFHILSGALKKSFGVLSESDT